MSATTNTRCSGNGGAWGFMPCHGSAAPGQTPAPRDTAPSPLLQPTYSSPPDPRAGSDGDIPGPARRDPSTLGLPVRKGVKLGAQGTGSLSATHRASHKIFSANSFGRQHRSRHCNHGVGTDPPSCWGVWGSDKPWGGRGGEITVCQQPSNPAKNTHHPPHAALERPPALPRDQGGCGG